MKLAWEPKVSLGNVISAVAITLAGFASYATFTSSFSAMGIKADALTIQVTAQGVQLDSVSGDVREIKAVQAASQEKLRDMSDRIRDLEKRGRDK